MPHDPNCSECKRRQARLQDSTKQDPIVTPGPWEYDPTRDHYNAPVVRRHGMIVCSFAAIQPYPSHGTAKGNGPLLAAAPELYRALAQLLKWIDTGSDPSAIAIEQGRLAIEKAGKAAAAQEYEES